MTKYMSPVEKRILTKAIKECEAAGFKLNRVYDGEEDVDATTVAEALEVVDSVESSTIWFTRGGAGFGVFVILGNEEDVISDWTDDAGFNVALEKATNV